MQKSNEITYLFGAGASAKSMPLVHSFRDRYEVYIKFLERMNAHPHFIMENQAFLREIQSHLSFDTYFKKLYHQRNREPDIHKGKYFIYLFFLFEHLCDIKYYNDLSTGFGLHSRKEFGCDPRYDALFAGLLKPHPQECEFYCSINILTWNYDLNLLWSLYNFLGQDVSFKTFLENNSKGKNIFEFNGQVKVFQLGGWMDPFDYFGTPGATSAEKLHEIFQSLIDNYNNDQHIQAYIAGLNFPWENVTNENPIPEYIQRASEVVCRSHSVMIIGYSFPLYNRVFDNVLLNEKRMNKKTFFISDPKASDYKKMLHAEFRIVDVEDRNAYVMNPAAPPIHASTVVDSFFVPPQVF